MKSTLLKTFIFILCLGSIFNSFSQNPILSKNARISVITCGTGNESYSLFGHTAIRVTDQDNDLDIVYNYGAFDFDTPNFVIQFIKGDLNYFIAVHRFSDFISEYTYEKRAVYEQELNISATIKQQLYDNLAKTILSDERIYNYKFIDNNCTSKVVDIINKTLATNIITKKTDTHLSYRSILFPYFDNHFYEQLGTSILFGTKVDQPGTKIFLPFELQKNLTLTQFQNQPLCKESKTLLFFQKEIWHSWWNNCYAYIFILGFIMVLNKRKIDLTYLFIISLFGVLFVFLGFYSSHRELSYNYNILLFNPALLLLLYFCILKNKKWIYKVALFNMLCLLFYFCWILNKAYLFIVSPIVITNMVILIRLSIRSKKTTPMII